MAELDDKLNEIEDQLEPYQDKINDGIPFTSEEEDAYIALTEEYDRVAKLWTEKFMTK